MEPTELTASQLADTTLATYDSLVNWFMTSLMRPWSLYQILIALGLALLAWLLARAIQPRFREWLRQRENWPTWRIRLGLLIHRRMRMIFFVSLIWITIAIMREMTWPSRSYLLEIMGTLAAALLFVTLTTRLINNAFLRSVVRYGAWTWVTLAMRLG